MLSNYKMSYLESRVKYFKSIIDLYPEQRDRIQKDMIEVEKMIEEVKQRRIVGSDDKGNLAYLTISMGELVLRVEDMPVALFIDKGDIVKGNTKRICYDGGTKWFQTVTFNVTMGK